MRPQEILNVLPRCVQRVVEMSCTKPLMKDAAQYAKVINSAVGTM